MAEFSSIYAKNYYDGELSQDWVAPSAKLNLAAGYKWNADGNNAGNWVMCLKITIPTAAKSISLSFCNETNGITVKQNLRYKFTKSEDDSLVNATSDVPGDGSFTINPGGFVRTTVTIEKILPAGTHYMYIWTDDSSVTSNVMWIRWYESGNYNFYGSYEETECYVYIGNGTGWDPYELYIGNGTGWDLYEVYVGNGTGWDACGG